MKHTKILSFLILGWIAIAPRHAAAQLGIPEPATATRFEESDVLVSYTYGWTHGDSARPWSTGTASVSQGTERVGAASPGTATLRSTATFTFTGTAVGWIGFRGPQAGIAAVFLDGVLTDEVDTYSPTEEFQVLLFEATGLADTSHTLTIEATGLKNPAATHSWVVVDAFDVRPAFPPPVRGSRFEETDPSATYTGTWTAPNTDRTWSGGEAAVSSVAGAQVAFNFTGTWVSWIGLRGPQTGIARLLLDGVFVAEVDTYSPAEVLGVLFRATGLIYGNHTLTIEVTGRRNLDASDSLVVVDAFDVRSRFEETHSSVSYIGDWAPGQRSRAFSGGTATFSVVPGAQATFLFTGTSVSWIGYRGPLAGIARVFLDGVWVAQIDTYAPDEEVRAEIFRAVSLEPGNHTLTIESTGQKNIESTKAVVMVDAFDTNLD